MIQSKIKVGDYLQVLEGAYGSSSPNRGKIVQAFHRQPDHPVLGAVWECSGHGLFRFGVLGEHTIASFAESWLRPGRSSNAAEKEPPGLTGYNDVSFAL
jgi:hypothetical protein